MSRSRKSKLVEKFNTYKFYKKKANRKIRQIPIDEEIPGGKQYKKFYCSYDICDGHWFVAQDFHSMRRYLTSRYSFFTGEYGSDEEMITEYRKFRQK